MKKASSEIIRFNKKALSVLMSILFSAVSAQGQAILSGDRSVPVEAKNGMVVTSHTLATEVALEVLKKGGKMTKSTYSGKERMEAAFTGQKSAT